MSSSRHDSTRVNATRSFKKSTPLTIRFSETRVQTKEDYASKQDKKSHEMYTSSYKGVHTSDTF